MPTPGSLEVTDGNPPDISRMPMLLGFQARGELNLVTLVSPKRSCRIWKRMPSDSRVA